MDGAEERITGTWAVVASLVLAGVAAAYLLVVPTNVAESTTFTFWPTGSGGPVSTRSETTLLEAEGWSALVPVLIPVILSAAPLLLDGTRYAAPARLLAAALLLGFIVVAGFSIGLFYLPSAVAMLLAAIWVIGSRPGERVEGEAP